MHRPPTPRRLVAVALTLVLALLAACGDGGEDRSAGAEPPRADAAFPVTVDSEHGEVTLDEAPERIVSLSPTLTEMVFAIDAGDAVVAADSYSNHPEGVPTTDLSGFEPHVEAIASYEPDLVLLSSEEEGVIEQLEGLEIPVLLLSSAADLDAVYEQIDVLGEATGHREEAAQLATQMRREIDEIVAAVPERDEPVSYFYELDANLYTATSETFIGELLGLLGLENVADGVDPSAGGYPKVSAEHVLDRDPELVLLSYGGGDAPTVDQVAGRPGWATSRAVRGGGIVHLDPDVASRWGPRIVDLLRAVSAAVEDLERQPAAVGTAP